MSFSLVLRGKFPIVTIDPPEFFIIFPWNLTGNPLKIHDDPVLIIALQILFFRPVYRRITKYISGRIIVIGLHKGFCLPDDLSQLKFFQMMPVTLAELFPGIQKGFISSKYLPGLFDLIPVLSIYFSPLLFAVPRSIHRKNVHPERLGKCISLLPFFCVIVSRCTT